MNCIVLWFVSMLEAHRILAQLHNQRVAWHEGDVVRAIEGAEQLVGTHRLWHLHTQLHMVWEHQRPERQ